MDFVSDVPYIFKASLIIGPIYIKEIEVSTNQSKFKFIRLPYMIHGRCVTPIFNVIGVRREVNTN